MLNHADAHLGLSGGFNGPNWNITSLKYKSKRKLRLGSVLTFDQKRFAAISDYLLVTLNSILKPFLVLKCCAGVSDDKVNRKELDRAGWFHN